MSSLTSLGEHSPGPPRLNSDAVLMNIQLSLMELVDAQNALMEVIRDGLTVTNLPVPVVNEVVPVVNVPAQHFDSKAFAQTLAPILAQFDQTEALKTLNNNILDLAKQLTQSRGVGTTSISSVNTRPLETAISNLQTASTQTYAKKMTTVGSITYLGEALPGTSQATAAWRCQKIDETSGLVITWAGGTAAFDKVATDLTALSYS